MGLPSSLSQLSPILLQANQIGHLICACCHMTLMFAHGAQSVKCAVCNHVTPVSMSSVVHPQQQQQQQQRYARLC